jgi:hypothetical protein
MLTKRATFTLLALLLASFSALPARTQQVSPGGQVPKAQQTDTPDQRGTPNQPLAVIVVPTAEQKAEANKQAAEARLKDARDGDLVDYTGRLVWVGVVQALVFLLQLIAFFSQARYMRRSAVVMERQAAAAEQISRDQIEHSHQTERAYMSGGGVPARRNVEIYSTATGNTRIATELTGDFELHINNHGKTPGELLQIAIEFCDADHLPTNPVYNPQSFHDWIGPGTQSRPMRWISIPKDRSATAVYGRIYYRDIFGRSHSSGFIQRLLANGGTEPLFAPSQYTAAD